VRGRGFCAGADLKDLRSLSLGGKTAAPPPELAADPGNPSVGDDFRGTYTYLMSVRKPIIAAINGPVVGMAVPIALCCDLRFASDRAVFTLAFSKRGLVASGDRRGCCRASSDRRTRSICCSRRAPSPLTKRCGSGS
jgi:enoyl-CoA hydratase/carnithine racemase